MRRSLRVTTLVAAAVTLTAVGTPPATAGDGGAYVVEGTATIPGGIGYPCTMPGGPGTTVPTTLAGLLAECPTPTVSPACLATGVKKCKPVEFTTNPGDMLTGTFTSLLCAGVEVNAGIKGKPLAPGKEALRSGPCVMTATFAWLGYCTKSTGEGTGHITLTNAITGSVNTTLFDFTWVEFAAHQMVFLFQWWKGAWAPKPAKPNKGLGFFRETPSLPASLPVVGTQSCTNHTQADLTWVGAIEFLPVKNP
jgi:hypothetical protein